MGDADHFSRSTDRDILNDHEDGVKRQENEKEVITTPALEAKKTPRAKSSRKNNRRGALVLAGDLHSGNVNAAEHEEQFCSRVNLYVDHLLVGAVKELMVDAHLREKAKERESLEENKDTKVESGPVFTATDDSYMDLICQEIHSTLLFEERMIDEEEDGKITNSDKHQDRYVTIDIGHMNPPFLSETEGEGNDVFEMNAEEYMNTSFPENDVDIDDDEYDSADDVFEDVNSSIQPNDSETNGIHRRRQHNKSRRKYEFEVDCETGMVFSFEIVEPGEDGIGDEYEYEDCDDCDGCDGRNSAEPDTVDGESNICIVEFEPDDDDCNFFQVINEDEDVEETVYMVVDDNGTNGKLARKTSNFRARSPTKLPRAIREGTEGHRRRCYSTGDAERFECLESSSSEFYSHADTIDRFLTLPSPPKSSPGSDGLDDSEEDMSSSQEELTEILDPPGLENHPGTSARLVALTDAINDTTDAFDDDPMITTESKCFIKNEIKSRESLPESGRNSNPRNEDDERRWQVRRVQHQMKLDELDGSSAHYVGMSYNTNPRATDGISDVDVRLERCQEMPKNTSSASGGMDSSRSAIQGIPPLNAKGYEEVTQTDQAEGISTTQQLPFDTGCLKKVKELVERHHDADENVFEYIRERQGRLSLREVNELLTDLAREKEAMDRMSRDAHRAQDEYTQLRKGVKKLLERLESCQPA